MFSISVHYFRAMRVRNDGDIDKGMEKCKSAILNVVGQPLEYGPDIGILQNYRRQIRLKFFLSSWQSNICKWCKKGCQSQRNNIRKAKKDTEESCH